MATANGRIRFSIPLWCFRDAGDHWSAEKSCQVAKELDCDVELFEPEDWPVYQKHGLTCASVLNGMPGEPFVKGLNNLAYHDEVIRTMTERIDLAADAEIRTVLAFTGYKWRVADDPASGEISRKEGAENCVQGLRKLAKHADARGVDLCLEMLNTRDSSHPMKGHPGYQGDDVDYVADIVRRVGSPRVTLLFDVYHVQLMQGDILRRLEETRDIIGHIHVAGVPGRGELDDRQEVNYPAVMHKLIDIGYEGHVGLEFLPTRDPLEGLKQAIAVCSVG